MAYIFYAFPPVTVSCFSEGFDKSSCLHRASIVSKTLFIVPTDTHYYKNHRMLKQFKILTLAPTCFGSSRNDHQGAVLCLAKITKYGFSVLVGIDEVNVMAAGVRFIARLHNRLICVNSVHQLEQ